uniref:Putative mrna-decapping enzyme 1b n=1 Tax=Ixodes ricinus TaxID=34613 RepID=A0A147BTI6_IXORI
MAAKPNYRQRCASESDSNHRNHGNAVAGGQNGATKDIVALLAKAKDQYDMKNAGVQNGCSVGNPKGNNGGGRARGGRRNGTTSSPPARNHPHPNNKVNNSKNNVAANGSHDAKNGVLFKPTPLRNNGVVAAAASPNVVEPPSTPLTVATLFAAVSGGRASVSPLPAEGKDVCNGGGGGGGGGGGREVLQELLSNPANLLEHVERMQRNEGASSGGQASPPADASPRHRAASCVATLSAWEATDDLRQKLRLAPQSSHGSGEQGGAGLTAAPQWASSGRPNRSPPPATGGETNAGEMFQSPAACDVPLLSPMAFTRSTSLIASSPPSSNSFSASGSPYMNGHVTDALIPPHALSGGRRPNSSSVTPLTKEQFRDALIFMLQTDNDFLVKIHEAYLGSLKSHFSVDVNSILSALGRL